MIYIPVIINMIGLGLAIDMLLSSQIVLGVIFAVLNSFFLYRNLNRINAGE